MEESKITLTEEQKIFKTFADSLRGKKKLDLHSILIFLGMLLLLILLTFMLTKFKVHNSIIFIIIAFVMFLSSSISKKIDMKKLKEEKCPICESKLYIYRNKEKYWYIECLNCNLSSSTGYSGITNED